ncbi:MAG: ATP-binding protein [Pedobacter sp.]|nr:ATP-binding protein [Pedobacter sp.]
MENTQENFDSISALNELLENYFRNTIIPQLFVDKDLVLRKFTPPAMKQFRLRSSDVGLPIAEIEEHFRFPTFIENINQVISSGEILEKEVQTLDLRWYQMNILPYVMRADGKTNGVIVTFVDITARIRDLKEQEKLIAEHELLLDTIAHDIKTPLTSVGMAIGLLKKVPEKGMENFPMLVANVEKGVEKVGSIVGELVSTRWKGHRYQAEEELLDLQNILEDVRLILAPQISQSGAEFSVDLEVSEILFIRRKLRSILYNLISNAIKYRAEDRKLLIGISAVERDGYMVIGVSDNGIGIEPSLLGAVFEKFQRIGEQVEGNGVGLYLVREILEMAGGRIEVESELGVGSTFRVFLKQNG